MCSFVIFTKYFSVFPIVCDDRVETNLFSQKITWPVYLMLAFPSPSSKGHLGVGLNHLHLCHLTTLPQVRACGRAAISSVCHPSTRKVDGTETTPFGTVLFLQEDQRRKPDVLLSTIGTILLCLKNVEGSLSLLWKLEKPEICGFSGNRQKVQSRNQWCLMSSQLATAAIGPIA